MTVDCVHDIMITIALTIKPAIKNGDTYLGDKKMKIESKFYIKTQ